MALYDFEVKIAGLMEKAADTIKQVGDVVVVHDKRITDMENRQDTMWKILQEISQHLSKEVNSGERIES